MRFLYLLLTVISIGSAHASYDFNGIVSLSNCSGSIIRFSGMPDTSNAIVMTNGHCLTNLGRMLRPGEVIYNQKTTRAMNVYNQNKRQIAIHATKILYSTMTKTDLTLYEVKETYNDLEKNGVLAFDLDGNHPSIGTSIDIVSGYWDTGYRCFIDSFVFKLKEGGMTMNDSIRYSNTGCNIIGGTSGSPIVQTGTRSVIGINNTANENGEQCTLNNPCEESEDGFISAEVNAAYGQQTYNVYTCLTPDFKLDLSIEGCELFK